MVLNCGILLKHRDGNKERGGGGGMYEVIQM